jgi:hypothetical protein
MTRIRRPNAIASGSSFISPPQAGPWSRHARSCHASFRAVATQRPTGLFGSRGAPYRSPEEERLQAGAVEATPMTMLESRRAPRSSGPSSALGQPAGVGPDNSRRRRRQLPGSAEFLGARRVGAMSHRRDEPSSIGGAGCLLCSLVAPMGESSGRCEGNHPRAAGQGRNEARMDMRR